MPAAGHLVHMPAHIYLRVGRYADAAEANVRAIAADEDYLAQCQAQGLYPVSYYPYNLHFLWAAATLEGRSAVAIDAALEDRLERAEAELTGLRNVMAHEAFTTTLKDLPLLTNLQIASRIVAGEIAARQGRANEAIRLLEEAVAIEDGIPYNEPPVWHQPPRQVLGALLLESGRAGDAERIYREDLRRFPDNGWSLFGLAQSLETQGRGNEAAAARSRFATAWARADIKLTSSRILTNTTSGTR
jgi:predicted Zn-dependent protease